MVPLDNMKFTKLLPFLVLLFLSVSCKHHKFHGRNRPIVGGVDAQIDNYPYQVSIGSILESDSTNESDNSSDEQNSSTVRDDSEQLKTSHYCGGSVISVDWVLTAAHCMAGSSEHDTAIRVGSNILNKGGQVHSVEKIIVHPDFEKAIPLDCDIALIKVKKPFEIGPKVKPIPLNKNALRPGTIATVTGWGTTTQGGDLAGVLQKVEVPIVPHWECEWLYEVDKLTDNMFCAGRAGRDSCQGDSGGPVMMDGHQIGVVSWGEGCGLAGYPGIYTPVHKFREWIRENSGV